MKNITLKSIAKVTGGELHLGSYVDRADREASCVQIDSRKELEGGIYIATKGARADGHSFIPEVFEKGALGVVCEKPVEGDIGPYILVEDSFKALTAIATYYREQLEVPVVGITGSVGKTSTKELVAEVLSKHYNVCKTQGNFNNEIGLPLSILTANEETEVLVLELGINHFGEMERLAQIAKPDVMLITNIGNCHLEYLEDRDGVLRAKTECIPYIKEGGALIINGDDDKLHKFALNSNLGIDVIRFGCNPARNVYLKAYEKKGLMGARVRIANSLHAPEIEALINLAGTHNAVNALAAVAVGLRMGLTTDEIREGLEEAEPLEGRDNLVDTGVYTIINSSYNANPGSMKSTLHLLSYTERRSVAVLGDMFELGNEKHRLHEELGKYIKGININVVILIGELSKDTYNQLKDSEDKEVYYFATRDEFLNNGMNIFEPSDVILVKASHGMGFEEIVKRLKGEK